MQDAIEPGDPLQRRLARYARVRLEPDPAATRRIRAAVMSEAWRRHLAAESAAAASRRTGSRVPFAGWSARRLGTTVTAAVLTGLLLAGTVFAGSRAGGPLYDTRLVLETALLPSDPEARVQAELAMAQTRLAEASQAAVAGDGSAFEAALTGYATVVDDLANAVGGPADRALAAVQLHVEVLQGLRARMPAPDSPGLDRALERSSGAVERLEQAGAGGDGGTPGAGPATPTAKPGNSPKPAKSPAPTAAPTGEAPEPSTTPKPGNSPKPGNTPKPGKTASPSPDEGEDGSSDR